MLRIVAGLWKGRRLNAPPGLALRPTQERVREALFSILYGLVENCSFLDLYAGTGVVGLEALSRGARRTCWVESDARALRYLRANIARIGPVAGVVAPIRVERFLRAGVAEPFDLVYADPPYGSEGEDALPALLAGLARSGIVASTGTVIIEQAVDEPLETPRDWRLTDTRQYGRTRLTFWNRDPAGRERGESP